MLLVRIEKTTQRLFLLLAGVLKQCENASRRRRHGGSKIPERFGVGLMGAIDTALYRPKIGPMLSLSR